MNQEELAKEMMTCATKYGLLSQDDEKPEALEHIEILCNGILYGLDYMYLYSYEELAKASLAIFIYGKSNKNTRSKAFTILKELLNTNKCKSKNNRLDDGIIKPSHKELAYAYKYLIADERISKKHKTAITVTYG